MSDWGQIARDVIAHVDASIAPGSSLKDRKAAIDAAYPFGERANWPYKAWLKARREYLKGHDPKAAPLFAELPRDPRHGEAGDMIDGREVPEWIGKTPDTPIPPRVKLRVFERAQGVCYLSGRKIRAGEPWDAEHVIAICNGGENRESNLAPALRDKHPEKTARDVATKSKTERMAKKHRGIWPKSPAWNRNVKRKMDGTVVRVGEQP